MLAATPAQIVESLASYSASVAMRHGYDGSDLVAGAMTLAMGILTEHCGWEYDRALNTCGEAVSGRVSAAVKGGA